MVVTARRHEMKKIGKIGTGIALGIMIEIISILLFIGSFNFHGNRLPVSIYLLLPYVAIFDTLERAHIAIPNILFPSVLVWSLFQMPIYGWLLGRTWLRGKISTATLLLLVLHILVACYALWMKSILYAGNR